MKYSLEALQLVAAIDAGIIQTRASFWGKNNDRLPDLESLLREKQEEIQNYQKKWQEIFNSNDDGDYGVISVYDHNFPLRNRGVKNAGDTPFLLFYRGDISLLADLNKNVAVIGCVDPTPSIMERERAFVQKLVEVGMVIVSGLAQGCDAIAHEETLANDGKTIAILPSSLNNITPAEHRDLAEQIVHKGGLLVSEYFLPPKDKYEAIKRFVDRDRLQAQFAKAVILTASWREGKGDSGSRHALEKAYKYGIQNYVMFNEKTDKNDKDDSSQFGLNQDLLLANKAKILTAQSIAEIKNLTCQYVQPMQSLI